MKLRIKFDRHVLVAIAFCVPVIIGRLFIVIFSPDLQYTSINHVLYIFRGIISDMVPTYIFGYMVSFIRIRYIIYFIWSFVCILAAANAEHILVNLGNIDLRYIRLGANSEFLKGSVLALRVLLLMSANLVLSYTIVKIGRRLMKRINAHMFEYAVVVHRFKRALPLFAIVSAFTLLLPTNYSFFTCIQMGIVEDNFRKTYFNLYSRLFQEKAIMPEKMKLDIYGQDLQAPMFIKKNFQKPNILVILLESIGYGTLESGNMPFLKKYAGEHIYYPRYLISQKQTNRGMYNVLCGDYPNLVNYKAKPDLLKNHNQACLPAYLYKSAGYSTIFLQSSDMRFMHKDKFIPAMGFREFYGDGYFKKTIDRAGWGVDDRTLYYEALDKIKEYNSGKKPWFMTLLTVGTHHPYRPVQAESSNYDVAVRYADRALEEFLGNLAALEILDNTLIVITADESHGPLNDGTIPLIGRNHSFMILNPPGENIPRKIDDLFAASDFMISIADYLNLSTDKMIGRSLFREYNREDRHLIFGNTYAGVFYYLDANQLHVCNYDFACSRYKFNGKFFEDYTFVYERHEKSLEALEALIQYNDWEK